MVDKRSKMIDSNRLVFTCIKCNYRYIGTLEERLKVCPACKHKDCLVIQGNLIVTK